MRKPILFQLLLLFIITVCIQTQASGQRYLSDYDSTLFIRDTLRPFLNRLKNLHVSGYIQPQFQVAAQKGARSYNGGNFSEFSNNRFMLRRARIKFDYILPDSITQIPKLLFTFQVDATERGVNVRDMFIRFYEPKGQNFSLTTGIFARPFGNELTLSSAYRETPERGRMSQILMTTERDLGAMISYEPHSKGKGPKIRWDAGMFNGQGLVGPVDFDSYKDFISRLKLKPMALSKNIDISGGLSLLYGGWRQATKYRYSMGAVNGAKVFIADSSVRNIGTKGPRHYYGADVQLEKNHGWGKTELRAEYWMGTQPGTADTTANPGMLPKEPMYIRHFDGAFFYFLQNIVNDKWQLLVKYDWYDPNTDVQAEDIGKTASNLSGADVKYSTLGLGLIRYFNSNLKIILYYDWVKNEQTALAGYTQDRKDNVFSCRVHVNF